VPQQLTSASIAAWSVWRDRLFWAGLAAGLALALTLTVVAVIRFESLPAIVPMHWDAQGQVDRLAEKAQLFVMPGIGMVVLAVNLLLGVVLHGSERVGARLLAWGAAGMQLVLWAAAWGALVP
jgi:uncharacterized membrane protein